MLILVVDGITTIIVWKHVRLSTILKVIVTEMMDVDGMPRQEVESVPRIARIRTVTRRVVRRIRSVVRGSMTRQHKLMTLEETLTSTTVTDLHGWSRMFGQELAAALVAVAVTVHSQ